mmetsp:Transcript_45209/g.141330  ORF Transcript_45209/g.141330 Transcript_45209/m.141330 type:complete len:256 (+) Transcript_45209:173-940(+)
MRPGGGHIRDEHGQAGQLGSLPPAPARLPLHNRGAHACVAQESTRRRHLGLRRATPHRHGIPPLLPSVCRCRRIPRSRHPASCARHVDRGVCPQGRPFYRHIPPVARERGGTYLHDAGTEWHHAPEYLHAEDSRGGRERAGDVPSLGVRERSADAGGHPLHLALVQADQADNGDGLGSHQRPPQFSRHGACSTRFVPRTARGARWLRHCPGLHLDRPHPFIRGDAELGGGSSAATQWDSRHTLPGGLDTLQAARL